MEIRLYDSATRQKQVFTPLDPHDVRMYVCGPTVYDRAHLGNARPVVVFDMLFRLLADSYGSQNVRYARNITDIDDKIMARAHATGRSVEAVAREATTWFEQDTGELGVLPPTYQPHATHYIEDMQDMIARLLGQGYAYVEQDHVLFAVNAWPEYGTLSGRSVDQMIAGARVEVAPHKREPMDFVLWKPSTPDQPGWDSPWGRGRPGWHIECSAMSTALFGADFDIHAGGADLMFPHHENEIAQSRAANPGSRFAQYWLHNEMVQVEGKKMAKSLGNFTTVADLLARGWTGAEIRLALLMTHYRKPVDISDERLKLARTKLRKWQSRSAGVRPERAEAFLAALADDLNTPQAFAEMDAAAKSSPGQLAGALNFMGVPALADA